MAAQYELLVDLTGIRPRLADIERGNPVRVPKYPTLHHAVVSANILRMALGLGMRRGPRTLAVGQTWDLSPDAEWYKPRFYTAERGAPSELDRVVIKISRIR